MRTSLFALVYLLAVPAAAQQPNLRKADSIRLAEAFRLARSVQNAVWPGWSEVPFAVLLVTPEHEFLVRHPLPSDDFAHVGFDSLLQSDVYVRDRVFSPSFIATFPAVGGVSTVVIGQPEQTRKSSTFWVMSVMHEHFHQLQNAQPDYYDSVAALDLANGDESGMWMLNYPFPYDSLAIGELFTNLRDALQQAMRTGGEPDVSRYLSSRAQLRDALSAEDYRYISFQLWQEGIARYTELRVAEAAARSHKPHPMFEALDDFVPYSSAYDTLSRHLARELAELDIAKWERVAFYPLGAGEGLLLDAVQPGWQSRYHTERFYLEHYYRK